MTVQTTPAKARRRTAACVAAYCANLMLTLTLPPIAAARGRYADLRRPAVEGQVPPKHLFVLNSAYPVALSRLADLESCAGLFSALGADGLEQLSGAVFYRASAEQEERICRARMGVAFTRVGGSRIGLCARFAELTRWEAAVNLIHEALHHAGMTEKPSDPDGLTSLEINRLVEASCDL